MQQLAVYLNKKTDNYCISLDNYW